MPVPHVAVVHVEAARKGFTDATSRSRTCWRVRSGATDSMSATVPDTIGAAKLVPPPMLKASASGPVLPAFESTVRATVVPRALNWPPGAEIVTVGPKLLYCARLPAD